MCSVQRAPYHKSPGQVWQVGKCCAILTVQRTGAGSASLASSVVSFAPVSAVSSVSAALPVGSTSLAVGAWGAAEGGAPIPIMQDPGCLAAERSKRNGSGKGASQQTGPSSPISAVPSVLDSLTSAEGNRSPGKSPARRKASVLSKKDVLAAWMQEHDTGGQSVPSQKCG